MSEASPLLIAEHADAIAQAAQVFRRFIRRAIIDEQKLRGNPGIGVGEQRFQALASQVGAVVYGIMMETNGTSPAPFACAEPPRSHSCQAFVPLLHHSLRKAGRGLPAPSMTRRELSRFLEGWTAGQPARFCPFHCRVFGRRGWADRCHVWVDRRGDSLQARTDATGYPITVPGAKNQDRRKGEPEHEPPAATTPGARIGVG